MCYEGNQDYLTQLFIRLKFTHIYITHPAKIFGHLSDYEAIYIFFKQDVATGHTEKKFYALGTDILFTEY